MAAMALITRAHVRHHQTARQQLRQGRAGAGQDSCPGWTSARCLAQTAALRAWRAKLVLTALTTAASDRATQVYDDACSLDAQTLLTAACPVLISIRLHGDLLIL